MARIIHTESGSATTVAGTIAVNITSGYNILSKIFVKSTTGSTSFDVRLTDIYSNDTVVFEDNIGLLNESNLGEPSYGNYTMTIENASADEAFTFLLAFLEN